MSRERIMTISQRLAWYERKLMTKTKADLAEDVERCADWFYTEETDAESITEAATMIDMARNLRKTTKRQLVNCIMSQDPLATPGGLLDFLAITFELWDLASPEFGGRSK